MSISASNIPVWPRRAPIASCLAVAMGVCAITASGRDRLGGDLPPGRIGAPPTSLAMPSYFAAEMPAFASRDSFGSNRPALTLQVMNCDDSGPGSLRDEIAAAASGATIDLSQLACSTITLSSEIVVSQNSLRVLGPGADQLTIDGASHSRIFDHTGSMIFEVDDLSIENGYHAADFTGGGCVSTNGTLRLVHSTVSHCVLYGTGAGRARGGGIFAATGLELHWSGISDSHAYSITGQPAGGGAYVAGTLQAKYSTISNNSAYRSPAYAPVSIAGGIFATIGPLDIEYSTISGNRSGSFAGLYIGSGNQPGSITNTTISSNVADFDVGGIYTLAPLVLRNSTVVGNTSHDASVGAGVRAENVALTLYSSIIAGNGGPDGEGDISGSPNATITGANNLIASSTLPVPGDTIPACPHIEPLANNGGPTLTHALKHDSQAIDHGSNTANLVDDQRLAPRVAGAQADIGAVEWQPGETDDRLLVSGFDGLCDG